MIFGSDFQFDKNCDDAVRRAADGKTFSRSVFALAVITLYSRRTSSFSYNIIMCCLFVSPPKFLLLFFFPVSFYSSPSSGEDEELLW